MKSVRTAALVVVGATVAVLPFGTIDLGGHPSFLPAVLALVTVFDLIGLALLRGQFLSQGDPRLLALSWAYSWSLVVMIGYALAFPGVVAAPGPLQTWNSAAPYLWVSWHAGFPLLLGLALAPWRSAWTRQVPVGDRSRLFPRSTALAALGGAALVGLVMTSESWAPSVISGLDTTRMTQVAGPGMALCCLLGATWAWRGARHRTGPERWAGVAAVAVCADVALTLASLHRFSLGWYAGRLLTVAAAAAVVLAMLSEIERTRRLLALESARLSGLLEHADAPISIKDLDGRYVVVNPAVAAFLGRPIGDIVGRTPAEVMALEGEAIAPVDAHVLATGETVQTHDVVTAADGTRRSYLTNRFVLRDDEGTTFALAAIGTDITELQQAKDELARLARTDSLTGLPNRSALISDLSTLLDDGAAVGGALVLVDLDRFKSINDTLGHSVGDAVVIEAGRRLAEVADARPGSLVARLGGDEFVLLLAPGPRTELLVAAQQALAALASPYTAPDLGTSTVSTSGSAGLTWISAAHRDVSAALREADLALYRSKDLGRGRLTAFDEGMHAEARSRMLPDPREPDHVVLPITG